MGCQNIRISDQQMTMGCQNIRISDHEMSMGCRNIRISDLQMISTKKESEMNITKVSHLNKLSI